MNHSNDTMDRTEELVVFYYKVLALPMKHYVQYYSQPSKSVGSASVDSTKCRSKYSEKKFQKVPKSKT